MSLHVERPRVARIDDLLQAAREVGPVAVAIAAAEDPEALLAARDAAMAGIAIPYLVGDTNQITELAAEHVIDVASLGGDIVNVCYRDGSKSQAASRAVQLVRGGGCPRPGVTDSESRAARGHRDGEPGDAGDAGRGGAREDGGPWADHGSAGGRPARARHVVSLAAARAKGITGQSPGGPTY